MFKFFVMGGAGYMTILTILLVAIFFAAWKAPRWINIIGNIALAFGFLTLMIGFFQMFQALQDVSDVLGGDVHGLYDIISPGVLFGGLKVALIVPFYGVIIYIVSQIVRIIKTPRL